MLVQRNGHSPQVHRDAEIAVTATVVGNVQIGARAYIDHNAVIASSGPPIVIGEETVVFAGALIRSVGGSSRPALPVEIGQRTLVSPLCVLTGCEVGRNCYVATAATLLQGAVLGDHVRVGAGAIVHAATVLPDGARVGMRHVAVPVPDGYVTTADVEVARQVVAGMDFFDRAFGAREDDQEQLHEHVMSTLLDEVHGWQDDPSAQHSR
jgi:carbonic anhydrase/acetyltransferase-like protein (isoleucine patch superfamily)